MIARRLKKFLRWSLLFVFFLLLVGVSAFLFLPYTSNWFLKGWVERALQTELQAHSVTLGRFSLYRNGSFVVDGFSLTEGYFNASWKISRLGIRQVTGKIDWPKAFQGRYEVTNLAVQDPHLSLVYIPFSSKPKENTSVEKKNRLSLGEKSQLHGQGKKEETIFSSLLLEGAIHQGVLEFHSPWLTQTLQDINVMFSFSCPKGTDALVRLNSSFSELPASPGMSQSPGVPAGKGKIEGEVRFHNLLAGSLEKVSLSYHLGNIFLGGDGQGSGRLQKALPAKEFSSIIESGMLHDLSGTATVSPSEFSLHSRFFISSLSLHFPSPPGNPKISSLSFPTLQGLVEIARDPSAIRGTARIKSDHFHVSADVGLSNPSFQPLSSKSSKNFLQAKNIHGGFTFQADLSYLLPLAAYFQPVGNLSSLTGTLQGAGKMSIRLAPFEIPEGTLQLTVQDLGYRLDPQKTVSLASQVDIHLPFQWLSSKMSLSNLSFKVFPAGKTSPSKIFPSSELSGSIVLPLGIKTSLTLPQNFWNSTQGNITGKIDLASLRDFLLIFSNLGLHASSNATVPGVRGAVHFSIQYPKKDTPDEVIEKWLESAYTTAPPESKVYAHIDWDQGGVEWPSVGSVHNQKSSLEVSFSPQTISAKGISASLQISQLSGTYQGQSFTLPFLKTEGLFRIHFPHEFGWEIHSFEMPGLTGQSEGDVSLNLPKPVWHLSVQHVQADLASLSPFLLSLIQDTSFPNGKEFFPAEMSGGISIPQANITYRSEEGFNWDVPKVETRDISLAWTHEKSSEKEAVIESLFQSIVRNATIGSNGKFLFHKENNHPGAFELLLSPLSIETLLGTARLQAHVQGGADRWILNPLTIRILYHPDRLWDLLLALYPDIYPSMPLQQYALQFERNQEKSVDIDFKGDLPRKSLSSPSAWAKALTEGQGTVGITLGTFLRPGMKNEISPSSNFRIRFPQKMKLSFQNHTFQTQGEVVGEIDTLSRSKASQPFLHLQWNTTWQGKDLDIKTWIVQKGLLQGRYYPNRLESVLSFLRKDLSRSPLFSKIENPLSVLPIQLKGEKKETFDFLFEGRFPLTRSPDFSWAHFLQISRITLKTTLGSLIVHSVRFDPQKEITVSLQNGQAHVQGVVFVNSLPGAPYPFHSLVSGSIDSSQPGQAIHWNTQLSLENTSLSIPSQDPSSEKPQVFQDPHIQWKGEIQLDKDRLSLTHARLTLSFLTLQTDEVTLRGKNSPSSPTESVWDFRPPWILESRPIQITYVPDQLNSLWSLFLPGTWQGRGEKSCTLKVNGTLDPSHPLETFQNIFLSLKAQTGTFVFRSFPITSPEPIQLSVENGLASLSARLKIKEGTVDMLADKIRLFAVDSLERGSSSTGEPSSSNGLFHLQIRNLQINEKLSAVLGQVNPIFFAPDGSMQGLLEADLAATVSAPLWTFPLEGSHPQNGFGALFSAGFLNPAFWRTLHGEGTILAKNVKINGSPLLNNIFLHTGKGTPSQGQNGSNPENSSEEATNQGTAPGASQAPTLGTEKTKIFIHDGQVSYDRLVIFLDDTPIVFSGSVGFAGNLGLKMDVPVDNTMISSFPQVSQYLGKTLTLSVEGTVWDPKVNWDRVIGKLARQAIFQGLFQQILKAGLKGKK